MKLKMVEGKVPGNGPERLEFFGLRMAQNQNALAAIDAVLKETAPRRILEIGAGNGGLTALFGLYGVQTGAQVISYDLKPCRCPAVSVLGVDYRQRDYWPVFDKLCRLIQLPERCLVFCDGGDKPREFRAFAACLKPGDVIMAHDYFEVVDSPLRKTVWQWCEITKRDIETACIEHGLKPIEEDLTRMAALCAMQKQ